MSGKNSKTAGQAAQSQAAQGPADPKPTVPGAAPATDAAAAADDETADDEHDSEDEEEHDDPETDDEEKAELRELVRQLRADNTDLQQQLTAERQRSGEAAGELNEAQTQLELQEAQKLIEDLQKRLERADTREAQSGAVIISHGEVDYKVLAPKFQFEGKSYQAADLKDDAALVARLVAAQVGFLHPLSAGE